MTALLSDKAVMCNHIRRTLRWGRVGLVLMFRETSFSGCCPGKLRSGLTTTTDQLRERCHPSLPFYRVLGIELAGSGKWSVSASVAGRSLDNLVIMVFANKACT